LGSDETGDAIFAASTPRITPIAPPITAIVEDSIRNCKRMSLRRAPMALRMPISLVRSVTLTSMIFMMTMPPTTKEIEAIAMVTMKKD
jgi:hypothetical protein